MAPTRPPVSGGRWKAIGLAVAVHLLLAAFLIVGIRWKTSAPPPLQAELFTPPVNPVPKPVDPVPPPAPKPPPPVQPAPKPDLAKPDIVTEKARLAAAEAERERFANARKETEKQLRDKKLAEEQARRKAQELADAKAAEDARKRAAEQARKEAAAKARKEAQEKARQEAEEKAALAAEEQRNTYLKGLMDKASGSAAGGGAASASGTTGAGGGGADSSYRSLLSSRIRAGTTFSIPAELSGNPKAVFVVTVMPDCTIAAIKLRKSSGVPSWDQAAERGIQRASPLPRMRDGTCPPELEITRGPRDSD